MTMVLVLAAVALALMALGLLLWQSAVYGSRRQSSARHMDRLLRQSGIAQHAAGGRAGAAKAWHDTPTGWNNLLLQAGIRPARHFYVGLAMRVLVVPAALAVLFTLVEAAAALVLLISLNVFHIWLRASKRHRKIVRQLPDFLEVMVRMMTVGNSLGAAFQVASDRVEDPLREVLDQARRSGSVGVELDVALRQAAELYRIYELYLVAAIIGVAIRVGGRSDHVLERMAAFMRDLTQARSELAAMSADIRLSAWVLALLPLGVGAVIVVTNEALMFGMWEDPMGRRLLIGAFVLQVVGSFGLYRLSRLE